MVRVEVGPQWAGQSSLLIVVSMKRPSSVLEEDLVTVLQSPHLETGLERFSGLLTCGSMRSWSTGLIL